jgi:hypothetical protein
MAKKTPDYQFGLYFDVDRDTFVACDIEEANARMAKADEFIPEGAWQIVLSTDVNAERSSGWFGKVKGWAKTMMNRLFKQQRVDDIIEDSATKGEVTGWSVGRLFDGRYFDRNTGKKYDEKSFTIEIRGIAEKIARKLAVGLAKKFEQQSVLLINLKNQRSRLVYAFIKAQGEGQVIRAFKYKDIAHGARSVVWWIDYQGKFHSHTSKGTAKDMHHKLDPKLNMDRIWRGRSTTDRGGAVTVLPPVSIYSRGAEDIPNNVMNQIERNLKPKTVIVDTMYGLKRVARKTEMREKDVKV